MVRQQLVLIALCLVGQIVVAQQKVAQDITAEIRDSDLESARNEVWECLGGKHGADIDEYNAYSLEGRQLLHLIFKWHEDTDRRKARYSAEFHRESASETWQLQRIGFLGEQTFSEQEKPLFINGYVPHKTVNQVIRYADKLWTSSTKAPSEFVAIVSNEGPPISCANETLGADTTKSIYEIHIRNLEPRDLPPRMSGTESFAIASSGSNDHTYKIRIMRDSRGQLTTTGANSGGGNFDPELIATLRENLDRPRDEADTGSRLRAAQKALPKEYRHAQIHDSQLSIHGPQEILLVQFEETEVSEFRKVLPMEFCSRMAGSDDDWQCHHQVMSISQEVPDQAGPVHVSDLELSEDELNELVRRLRAKLANHPDVPSTAGNIQVLRIFPEEHGFQGSFISDTGFFSAVFTYDGNVDLITVEQHH